MTYTVNYIEFYDEEGKHHRQDPPTVQEFSCSNGHRWVSPPPHPRHYESIKAAASEMRTV